MKTIQQRLPASLTPLDVALGRLLQGLRPVAPVEIQLAEAVDCMAAEMPPFDAYPSRDMALVDGWALRATDLVGASSYTPLPLPAPPVWVEAGDEMPGGCDCVVDDGSVDRSTSIVQVLAEAIPGQGVRREGSEIAVGSELVRVGQPLLPQDLLLARAAGIQKVAVRRPRVRVLNLTGGTVAANLMAENARAEGAEVIIDATDRDAASIAKALDAGACDLLVSVGGSGQGRADATIEALRHKGEVLAHGIALQPGRTTAIGRIGSIPVVALPGAPDQALAAWWTLARPLLDRLSGRKERRGLRLPLARKIASSVGLVEIVLLERGGEAWMPLAVGDLPLQAIARADAWLLVRGDSEGFAAGATVDAYMLRE